MPFKLSEIPGLNDGLSSTLQSTVSGSAHDGVAVRLVDSALSGSLAPALSTAVLLAMGGVHLYRRRSTLAPSLSGALPV